MRDVPRGSAGVGRQMAVQDLDQHGHVDIVAPEKSGLSWFENRRITKPESSN